MQISINFECLRTYHTVLSDLGGLADAVLNIDSGSALTRLRSITEVLTQAIYNKECLIKLPQANFFKLVNNVSFKSCVNAFLIHQLHFICKEGNESAHGGEGKV